MAEQIVTVEVLSKHLGITSRQIQKLVKQDILPKSGRGEYPFTRCIMAYIKYLQGIRDAAGGADIEESKKRKAHAEAVLLEIEVAKAQEDVVSMGEYGEMIIKISEVVKGELMRLPSALSLELSNETSQLKVHGTLKTYVRKALTDLADLVANLIREVEEEKDRDAPLRIETLPPTS